MSELLDMSSDDLFVKELMVGDLKYHFRLVKKKIREDFNSIVYIIDNSIEGWSEEKEIVVFSERTFNKSKIEIQTLDGSYMKVGTFYKPNIIHLDRVELQTYHFDETLTCIEDFESKVVEVELRTYMRFLG